MTTKTSNRLLALDVMRGITIAGMIMVNNPGSWSNVYEPLYHAQWNGLTPTDLVFPFFMFIMGISTYISLSKFNFEFSRPIAIKIIKRTAVIFLIGVVLAWFGTSFYTYHGLSSENLALGERLLKAITNFENLRILGVLQRLALSYGIAALVGISVKHKYIPYVIASGLIAYFLILIFGNGYEQNENNILSVVDIAILGKTHMYYDSGIDPEGILSTIPAVCHVLIGFMCGRIIIQTKDNKDKMLQLFIVGAILTFSGFLLSYGCAINKKIWSPTFVLTTCGLGATLLSLLIWIIDVKGYKKWCVFFESFGVNPLFIYVLAGVLATLLDGIRFTYNGELTGIKSFIYNIVLQPALGDKFSSLVFALLFVGTCWIFGNILYKNKIYIKI